MDEYTTGGGTRLRVHAREDCVGLWCVIHRPMSGPWQDWPTHWRADRKLMERICPHGVGHPAVENIGPGGRGHGCCGCPCSVPVIEGEWK